MKYKYIIWDFDGTIVDTYGAIVKAFCESLQLSYGISVSKERVLDLVKIDTKHCASVFAKENGINEQDVVTTARNYYDNMPVKEQNPFPFVRELCMKIVGSGGKNYLVTHRDRSSLEQHLSSNELAELFDEVITEDDGFPQKPDPKSFRYMLKKHALPSSEVLGIGDREIDVEAANNSGITSVFFCPNGNCSGRAKINVSCISQLLEN